MDGVTELLVLGELVFFAPPVGDLAVLDTNEAEFGPHRAAPVPNVVPLVLSMVSYQVPDFDYIHQTGLQVWPIFEVLKDAWY